jgi:hypothetical protein
MPTEEALVLKEVEVLPLEKLFERETIDPILERIKVECLAIPVNVNSERGRKECASLAYKIARSKGFIEDRHKELVGKEKRRLAEIDSEWKRIRETLDALKTEVRKPLTEWEKKEEDRTFAHEQHISRLEESVRIKVDSTTAEIAARIALVEADDASRMEEFTERGEEAKAKALEYLRSWHARSVQRDAEKVELERLRVEKEKRDREDRERQIAEQATKDTESRAARQVQEAKDAAARAEQAAADLLAKTERDAEEARARAQREQEAAVQRERERASNERRTAEAEEAKRESDRQHCAKINREAMDALVAGGVAKEAAKLAVQLIAKGQIPNVRISY